MKISLYFLRIQSCFLGVSFICLLATACGDSSQPPIVQMDTTKLSSKAQTDDAAGKKPNAGRYTDYYLRKPISGLIKPFEPQPLFYSLLYNCGGCHEFTRTLNTLLPKLEKNNPSGSIQDAIASGRMPPNDPNFAASEAGQELIDMLNRL
jgi:hypothetical protein